MGESAGVGCVNCRKEQYGATQFRVCGRKLIGRFGIIPEI